MELTSRETWAVVHGLLLGTLYLLAFGGALAGPTTARRCTITDAHGSDSQPTSRHATTAALRVPTNSRGTS